MFNTSVKGQLTVTRSGNYGSMPYLVNNVLLGTSSGIVATNITYQGIDTSFGFFNGTASNIGMDTGLIITNGTISLAAGPNRKTTDVGDTKFTTYAYSTTDGWPASATYQDTDLANLIGTTVNKTFSCAVLQFDFVANSDSVQFQYSFGSNEEPHYVGSKYLDDFGFFLSGPGIAGPFTRGAVNLAVIPNTKTAVYIDSVNCTINSTYYVCNYPNSAGCSSCPPSPDSLHTTVGYNGFTTVLTAKAAVKCGKKYHIKLGVADIGNGKFDSGVFLKGGSFKPGNPVMVVSTSAVNTCAGNPVTLSASGAGTYNWSPSTGLSATSGDTVIATPLISTTYTVIGNAGGCGDSSTIAVNVSNPSAATVGLTDSICKGDSTILTVNGTGLNYVWNTGATTSTIKVAPASSTTYTVIASNACSHDTLKQSVVVLNPPTVTITGNDTICSGSSDNLTANGGINYTWNTGASGSTINVSPLSKTTYTVTSNGKCPATAAFTVNVATASHPSISGKDSVCSGGSVTLTASGGTNYLWSNGSTGSSITVNPTSSGKYYVILKSSCGNDTAFQSVTVTSPVNPVISSSNDTVCAGTTTVLTVAGGSSYTWSTGSTNTSIVVSPSVTTTYSATANNGGCPGSATYTVNIRPKPVITISGVSSTCANDTIVLTATSSVNNYTWNNGATTSTISVVATSSGMYYCVTTKGCSDTAFHPVAVTGITPITACCDTSILAGGTANLSASGAAGYVWSPSYNVECYTCPGTTATPGSTTTYTVMGTDANGCRSYGTVTVTIECEDYEVPNVFTPNSDGINDVFTIKAYSETSYSIEIYNRWGLLMYKSNTPNAPWTGKDESGVAVPDGVYYYIIKSSCSGAEYDHHGFVQVIK